jgi:hypothetical protein
MIFWGGHFSNLAAALIQTDLQSNLGLSALLKGTLSDFHQFTLGIGTSKRLVTGPML